MAWRGIQVFSSIYETPEIVITEYCLIFLKALVPDLTQETGTHHPALPAHRTAAVFACTECAFHVQQICDLVPLGSPHISVWTHQVMKPSNIKSAPTML